MTWQLVFTDQYTKRAARFLKRNPAVRMQYAKTLDLLSVNPFHPSLRLHKLQGALNHLHGVSINLQHRVTIEMVITDREIIPINVGDHNAVY
jgi:mRNA-degrading endonuclease YafQ of YafQ-DinJ toxin-antitoxin module